MRNYNHFVTYTTVRDQNILRLRNFTTTCSAFVNYHGENLYVSKKKNSERKLTAYPSPLSEVDISLCVCHRLRSYRVASLSILTVIVLQGAQDGCILLIIHYVSLNNTWRKICKGEKRGGKGRWSFYPTRISKNHHFLLENWSMNYTSVKDYR